MHSLVQQDTAFQQLVAAVHVVPSPKSITTAYGSSDVTSANDNRHLLSTLDCYRGLPIILVSLLALHSGG